MILQLQGIIIKTFLYRESQRIVHLLTDEHGKLSLITKQPTKKRYGSGLDLFDYGKFTLRRSRGELYNNQLFIPITSFRSLREDLNKISIGSTLCEAFDLLTHDQVTEGSRELFHNLRESLTHLERSDDLKHSLRICFESLAHILQTTGYLDPQQIGAPSAKNLNRLLDHIEHIAEREMRSKKMLIDTVDLLS